MVTFRNNNKRNNFRKNEKTFKSGIDRSKFNNSFSNNDNFKRKNFGRNNHNAGKLIEKYTNLAREALSSGDKILSENYFQHADHFLRIINDQQLTKKTNQILYNNEETTSSKDSDNNVDNAKHDSEINQVKI